MSAWEVFLSPGLLEADVMLAKKKKIPKVKRILNTSIYVKFAILKQFHALFPSVRGISSAGNSKTRNLVKVQNRKKNLQ